MVTDRMVQEAARAVRAAMDGGGGLVIAAGAGMGVDSGLPDFRGPEGFWRAYPAYRQLGLRFEQLANPSWFERDAALVWGFYGHRLNLYRETIPHEGFAILRHWLAAMPSGGVVYTSNVDGQFQRAGFGEDQMIEVHGSLHYLQCLRPHCYGIWSAEGMQIRVDEESFRAVGQLPQCPDCGGLARPNVLMFGDACWQEERTGAQHMRLAAWLEKVAGKPLVVVECGAGTAVPTVRAFGEFLAARHDARLIRINVREPQGPSDTISLACGALEGLRRLDAELRPR